MNTDLSPYRYFQLSANRFPDAVAEVFQHQYAYEPTYRKYVELYYGKGYQPKAIDDVPFLPIGMFKYATIKSGAFDAQAIFESSGTTGQLTSKHHVKNLALYKDGCTTTFINQVGEPEDMAILALLPSYLERSNSSLVSMVDWLITMSDHEESGFYLDDLEGLSIKLANLKKGGVPTLLIGVSFALLDLAERFPQDLSGITIMETGGMKGRRKELIREELHGILQKAFQVEHIASEYGMTELLSQAYAMQGGRFKCPPWMSILIRDPYDPKTILPIGQSGLINVIDLANFHSCSFIATDDIGKLHSDGTFEVLGRQDNAEIRGCNLMVF